MLTERTKGGPGRATDNRLLLSASQKDPGCQRNLEHQSPGEGREPGSRGNPVHSAGEPSALFGRREQHALGNTVPMGREHGSVGREPSSVGREQSSL